MSGFKPLLGLAILRTLSFADLLCERLAGSVTFQICQLLHAFGILAIYSGHGASSF